MVPDNTEPCIHEWGLREDVRDDDFNVKFGERAKCLKCGAILFDDWTAMRAGSVERILLPVDHTEEREPEEDREDFSPIMDDPYDCE